MTRSILVATFLALLAGCGSPKPAAAPPPPGGDPASVPPAQMRRIVEGLQSTEADTQLAALEALGRYPTVVPAHRRPIERLKANGKDERVRQKAAELLASLAKQKSR